MARRFYSADFHLGFESLLEIEKWPFESIEGHDAALLASCGEAKAGDVIVHLGDLASYGADRHSAGPAGRGLYVSPMKLVEGLPAAFFNVRGNHDASNRVKSVADSLQTHLGRRFPQVTMGHYPSYDKRARDYVRRGWINVCGHVHSAWRHCLDLDRQVLNVNVGCMAWGFRIVPEEELALYISRVLSHRPDKICRCRRDGGRTVFYPAAPGVEEETTGKDREEA